MTEDVPDAPKKRRRKKRPKRAPRLIDWYRVDTTARIREVLGVAAALVLLGSLLGAVCVGMVRGAYVTGPIRSTRGAVYRTAELTAEPRDEGDLALALGVLALGLVASGGATAIVGLMRELRDERWLAMRTDGLVIASGGTEKRARWSHIEDVRMEGSVLVVALESGDVWSIRDRFAGTTRAELSKQIAQVRRRALHGLLRRS